MSYIRFEVDLNGAGAELERLQHPPVRELEAVLAATFVRTEARVHVDTGELKASGHPSSEFAADVWSGTISFDRYPGIFELARGPHPTPHQGGPGSHFFMDSTQAPGYGDYDVEHGDAYRMYSQVIEDFLMG